MRARWREIKQKGSAPMPRSSHVCVAVGNTLVVAFGERVARIPLCSKVFGCDMETTPATWRVLQTAEDSVPCPRVGPAATVVGSTVWLFGGRTGEDMGEGSLDDLWVLQPGQFGDCACWDRLECEGELPVARSYHAMASHGSKIFVFGGCSTAGRLNDLWECDTAIAPPRWRQLPTSEAVRGRGGAGFCCLGDHLYVYGGFCGHELADVHRFDLNTQTWECLVEDDSTGDGGPPRAGLPPRSVFASAAHGGRILLFGGEVDPSTAGHAGAGIYSNQAYAFDPATCKWTLLKAEGEPPPPRGWLAGTAIPSGLLVHGGNSCENERQGDMWLLEIERD